MNGLNNDINFDVLGYKIKLSSSDDENAVGPHEIVNFVNAESEAIKKSAPHLDNGQIAVLIALKCAKEKMTIEREYKDSIGRMRSTAKDALQFIEEVSPTTV